MGEVKKHNNDKDMWCVIHGVVYDLTPVLDKHPGGAEVLLDFAGQDATDAFEDIGHSFSARQMATPFAVGVLEGCEDTATGCVTKPPPTTCSAQRLKNCESMKGGVGAAALVVLAAVAAVYYIFNLS